MVAVLVGPGKQRFEIHKGLVCQYWFFKAAFEGNFKESKGTILLPEQDPEIFRWLSYWLYTGKLSGHYYPSTTKPSIAELGAKVEKELELKRQSRATSRAKLLARTRTSDLYELARYRDLPFDKLIDLYLLADYLQILGLRDQIIDRLVDVYGSYSMGDTARPPSFWGWTGAARPQWLPDPVSSINAAWSASSKDSKLFRLLVTLFSENTIPAAEALQDGESLNPEFLTAALVEAQDRWVSHRDNTDWEDPHAACAYHVHDELKAHD
ncbi:MAG: hypothetical protein Q9225_002085 [Loekoesia sp. 1 TL-2023]